jgi:hypothetical protein
MEVVCLESASDGLRPFELPEINLEDQGLYPFPNDTCYSGMQVLFAEHTKNHPITEESSALVVGSGIFPYISGEFPNHIVVADYNPNSLACVRDLCERIATSGNLTTFRTELAELSPRLRDSLVGHIQNGNIKNHWAVNNESFKAVKRNLGKSTLELVKLDLADTEAINNLGARLKSQGRELAFANMTNVFAHIAVNPQTTNLSERVADGPLDVSRHIVGMRTLPFARRPFILASTGMALTTIGPFHSVEDYGQRVMRETTKLFT